MDKVWWNPFTWWNKDLPQASNQNFKINSDPKSTPDSLNDSFNIGAIDGGGYLSPLQGILRSDKLASQLQFKVAQISNYLSGIRINGNLETFQAVKEMFDPKLKSIQQQLKDVRESKSQIAINSTKPLFDAINAPFRSSIA